MSGRQRIVQYALKGFGIYLMYNIVTIIKKEMVL